ncbi:MAG: glycosyltransferase [Gallionellales bacterium GWA2_60_142]|nr:MAG: glycosyltransferase [Gallionellales bacterium GWA2_60_142]HCI12764.1 glycosyltransferase [Gallionellaceae bacterium]
MPSIHQVPDKSGTLKPSSVCAVVVAYFPDQGFEARLHVLLPQVGKVVVVDNTPEEDRILGLKEFYGNDAQILVIENRSNLGIAAALSQGLGVAVELGFEWILTLDQDTKCYPDMVLTLLQVYESCGKRPSVIGGNYYDYRKKQLRIRMDAGVEFIEQKTVITAGCLIDTCLATAIGGFRDDYFIDQVDHEFCLRARSKGYRVYISRLPVMEHSIGDADRPHRFLLGLAPPDHSPLRKYYIARNSLVSAMDYWKVEPVWCLQRMVWLLLEAGSIALLQKNPIFKLRAFFAGISDGMHRRMGPCRSELLSE